MSLIHVDLFVRRRLELGLTQRELGRSAKMGFQRIRHLEAGGSSEALQLGELQRLSSALALEPWELLSTPAKRQPSRGSDATRIEAALLRIDDTTRTRLLVHELAAACNLSLSRTQAALADLDARYKSTGAALSRAGRGAKIVARESVLTRAESERLDRSRIPKRQYAVDEAVTLGRLARGELTYRHLATDHGTRRAVGALLRRGDIRLSPSREFELAPRTDFSLGRRNRLPRGRQANRHLQLDTQSRSQESATSGDAE